MATETAAPVARGRKDVRLGTDRLPVAPRQRRPALAALAVLLILGGALISAVLVLRSGEKEGVIMLNADVQAGQVIERGDLVETQAGGLPEGSRVPWRQYTEVVGLRAGADLRQGTILHPLSVSKTLIPGKDQVSVGLSLTPDQLPAGGLKVGDYVRVVFAPAPAAQQQPSVIKFTPPDNGRLVERALVLQRGSARSDGRVTITLVVGDDEALVLAQQGRQQAVALLALPKAS